MIHVRLDSGGNRWIARWRIGDKSCARTLGHKPQMSRTDAARSCQQLQDFLNTCGHHNPLEVLDQPWRFLPGAAFEPVSSTTCSEAFEDFLRNRPLSHRSRLSYRTTMRRITEFGRENESPRDWTAQVASQFVAFLEGGGRSPNTVRRYVREARAFFNYCQRMNLLDRNPFEGFSSAVQAPNTGWEYVSPERMAQIELAALRRSPSGDWHRAFKLARWAGLRRGEILRLRWCDVDVPRNMLHIDRQEQRTTKRAYRVVPIEPRRLKSGLYAVLAGDSARATAPTAHVVYGLPLDAKRFYKELRAILAESGVEDYGKPLQVLRRNYETDLVALAYPQAVVSKWLGHSMEVSGKFYVQVPAEMFERDDPDNPPTE